MILDLDIGAEFGGFCADGEAAARYRERHLDPYVGVAESIVLDFASVRNANTSFCNALIANLVILYGSEILQKLRFRNCRENVKVLVCAALELASSMLKNAPSFTTA
jgi:hypothetical protein